MKHITKQMSVQSFNAVCNEKTHTLILGSMPGVASLGAVEYYAHKRNAFWPIMLALVQQKSVQYGLTQSLSYQDRLACLSTHGFGLWDVLAECERKGSLDSAIVPDSIIVNDIIGLLARYPSISTIAFNGKAAQKHFERHIKKVPNTIRQVGLPSSSPAMASLTLEQKFKTWAQALQPVNTEGRLR